MTRSGVFAVLICLASLGLIIHASMQKFSMPRIDDLSVSVVEALKRLPDVVEVELKVQVEKPPQRIVHLRDWHFINRDAFGIDAQNSSEDELILGGSHDLSESVRQHVGCEYIQITTKRFKEFGD